MKNYFPARVDRYNHDIGEDTDDTDDSPLFGSFSSYSPQSRKISQTRPPLANESELDYTKKQLFSKELERMMAQLSPSSSTVSVSPPSKLIDKIQNLEKTPPLKSSPLAKTEKSDNSFTSPATISSGDSQLTIVKSEGTSGTVCLSTPESSQTESDDISPQIQRKRHIHSRDKLPRFSISIHGDEM